MIQSTSGEKLNITIIKTPFVLSVLYIHVCYRNKIEPHTAVENNGLFFPSVSYRTFYFPRWQFFFCYVIFTSTSHPDLY